MGIDNGGHQLTLRTICTVHRKGCSQNYHSNFLPWPFDFMSFICVTFKEFQSSLYGTSKWNIGFVWLWLAGPFLYLIERTPADIWLSLFGIAFLLRSFHHNQWRWLSLFWVRSAGIFWLVAVLVSGLSDNPLYSLGEAIVWIRFPLYAAACMFWLGNNRYRLTMMFVSMGVATAIMAVILAIEIGSATFLHSNNLTRLSGPYGDLIPGSFLGKAMMPMAIMLAAMAMEKPLRHGLILAMISGLIVLFTAITGERVNTMLVGIAVFLAAFSWVIKPRRILLFGTLAMTGFLILFAVFPNVSDRFSIGNKIEMTNYFNSPYWFSVRPGIVAAMDSPITGIGVGMHRLQCPKFPQGPQWLLGENDCHPHPHQFYVQMAEETGLMGLLAGVIMILSIIITAAVGRKNRTLYSCLAWIPPALLFFPQPSADFFGQWNNLFLWFAIGLALAMSQDKNKDNLARR